MVIKKEFLLILTLLCLIIFTVGSALGACSSIIGDWDFTGSRVSYDESGYEYGQTIATAHITTQDGCLFYGYLDVPADPTGDYKFTGAIRGTTVTMTSKDAITTGTLYDYNSTKKIYKRMKYITSELDASGYGFGTHKGTAVRK
jgi:hypothetical protein